jgi:SAM-dependent methyltransferase
MPTSPYVHIQTFVNYLLETNPTSILDIGLGNGKLGFVARDLLDVMIGERYRKEDRRIRIDGIEIFGDYIQNLQREIYDHIFIGDAYDLLPTLGDYDMIFIGDVLEHFEKPKAWRFLDRCMEKTKAHVIINIPLGEAWEQPEIYGNPYEKHRSIWMWPDLQPFVWQYKFFDIHPDTYATLLIRKEDYLAYKYDRFMNPN